MKNSIRLTESELTSIIKRVVSEQSNTYVASPSSNDYDYFLKKLKMDLSENLKQGNDINYIQKRSDFDFIYITFTKSDGKTQTVKMPKKDIGLVIP